MKSSEQIGDLATALAKAQAAMSNVNKGKTATIKTDKGGYSYSYADLADVCEMIRRPLADNGLAILQCPDVTGNRVEVETVLMHTSGQWASCTVGMGIAGNDAKSIGSAITYARRYGMALIGVVTDDDDDGDAAIKSPVQRTKAPAKPAQDTTDQEWQKGESLPNPANGKTGGSVTPEATPEHRQARFVRGLVFGPYAVALATAEPYYARSDGTPDYPHITGAAAKVMRPETPDIGPENVDRVIALLKAYAVEQKAIKAATTPAAQ